MRRLTKRLEDGGVRLNVTDYGEPPYPVVTNDFIRKLAEYEDLEEQGRIVKLPCKEGTTIYQICYKCVCTLGHTYLHNTCHSPIECRKCRAVKIECWIREATFSICMLDRIGVDFFVTREEAEEVLKNI